MSTGGGGRCPPAGRQPASPPPLQLVGKLSGGHKGSITCMCGLPRQGKQQEWLLAGDSMGGLHVWDPLGKPLTLVSARRCAPVRQAGRGPPGP